MSSLRKIESNRQNAMHSTGPITNTGRQISSQNRTSHGLTSRRAVLKSENQSDFDQLLSELTQDYNPQSTLEKELVQEIADNAWRLRRAAQIEAGLFDQADDDFQKISSELDKLRRYRTAIERAWHKAIDQLRKIQSKPVAQIADQKANQIRTQAIDETLAMILGAPLPGQGPESAIEINLDEEPDEDQDLDAA